MPTLLRFKGYRFYFYSQDVGEPPHVHVDKGGKSAKFWLGGVVLVRNTRFTPRELREIARIIGFYRLDFLGRWHDYFDDF